MPHSDSFQGAKCQGERAKQIGFLGANGTDKTKIPQDFDPKHRTSGGFNAARSRCPAGMVGRGIATGQRGRAQGLRFMSFVDASELE